MNELILYKSDDGAIKVDVMFEGDTVWLSQSQMAELFGKGRSTITEHIKHIFARRRVEGDCFLIVPNTV